MSQQTTNPKDFGPAKGRTVNTSRDIEQTIIRMSRRKSRKGYRTAQVIAYGSLAAVLGLVTLNLANAASNASLAQQLSKQVTDTYNPAFKVRFEALGQQVISSYYAGGSAPVNLAEGVSWPTPQTQTAVSATPVESVASTTALPTVSALSFLRGDRSEIPGLPGQYQERLSYYAIVNGVPSTIAIALSSTEGIEMSGLPTLLSTPSINRADPISSVKISTKPQGEDYKNVDMSSAMKEQVEAWAKAWVSDDRASLKQITQDRSEDSYYAGMGGGWEYVPDSAQVVWSVSKDATTAFAEVTFTMKVPDSEVTTAAGTQQSSQTITGPSQTQRMDLMITGYDTGLPAIVSWGNTGSYTTLSPTSSVLTEDQAKALPTTPAKP